MPDTDYLLLTSQLRALLAGESDTLANSANLVALLYDALQDVNWLGIYVLRGSDLVLGPFQGKPACVRIQVGTGVCGAAAATRTTQRVADVHEFPGHIVCDPASRSELVVPLTADGELIGVLDIDSPSVDRFGEADQAGIESLCAAFCESLPAGAGFI
jgi:L-methionine (R)-S-oxide reductase